MAKGQFGDHGTRQADAVSPRDEPSHAVLKTTLLRACPLTVFGFIIKYI